MNRIKTIMFIVLALVVVSPAAAAPVVPDPGGIDAEGTVDFYEDGVMTVDGVDFIVNDATLIITDLGKGDLASLDDSVGVWVSVSGYTDADGQVVARKVKMKPAESDNPDSEDEPEDEDKEKGDQEHPVAMWISNRFGVGYAELMGMHEDEIGWGTIVKAYFLAQVNEEVSGEELITKRQEGEGWGNITRELNNSKNPGKFAPAWGRNKERNPNAAPKK